MKIIPVIYFSLETIDDWWKHIQFPPSPPWVDCQHHLTRTSRSPGTRPRCLQKLSRRNYALTRFAECHSKGLAQDAHVVPAEGDEGKGSSATGSLHDKEIFEIIFYDQFSLREYDNEFMLNSIFARHQVPCFVGQIHASTILFLTLRILPLRQRNLLNFLDNSLSPSALN